ncbi:MAG: N-acyl homoserine lactonase family protein [Thermoplasmatota archaeon]
MNGDPGTAKKVKLMSDGTFTIDGGMLVYGVQRYYGVKFQAKLQPLYIESGEERILVDTGVGDLPEDLLSIYGVKKNTSLPDSLALSGISPEDITMVINTHLHFDHAGYNRLFRHARFITQSAEISYSRSPDRFQKGGYHMPKIDGIEFDAVTGENEVAPGVTVIPTPGHTPGHQSVMVELDDEIVIYTGDVSPLAVNREKKYIVGILHNPVQALSSLNRLDQMGSHRPNKPKRFIYSHE